MRARIPSTGTGNREVVLRELIAASIGFDPEPSTRTTTAASNATEGPAMSSIDWEFNGATPSRKWRNLATGECRATPPVFGELDWMEASGTIHCPD